MKNTKSKGLGDTVQKVLKKTKVDKIAKFILGDDCNCDKRKEILNKMFPYKQIQCLIETEYNYLKEFFSIHKNVLKPEEQEQLLKIHNRVFNTNREPSNCSSCVRELINEMKKLYKSYEAEEA